MVKGDQHKTLLTHFFLFNNIINNFLILLRSHTNTLQLHALHQENYKEGIIRTSPSCLYVTTYVTIFSKKSTVKKWLHMFPALNKSLSLLSGSFIAWSSFDTSLYSATWLKILFQYYIHNPNGFCTSNHCLYTAQNLMYSSF